MGSTRHFAALLAAAVLACTSLSVSVPSAASSTPTSTQSSAPPAFTYDRTSFYLHGSPYVIIGGQMDPQRIPVIYWRDRLAKARAMGLNTIFSYVYWNLLEPSPGEWRNGRNDEEEEEEEKAGGISNDIAAYFRIAQEEGLNVILRPGPYICGEREWGGFPAWLAQIPGMRVRSSNAQFMEAAEQYLVRLAADLKESQVTRGGPLLMVQVENEYGSYGEDHVYTSGLRDILRRNFEVPLYTNDGGVDWTLSGGEVPGVLAEIDGDPWSGFAAREKYITEQSELGPLMDGEYYTLAPDFWGADNVHNTTVGRPSQIAQFVTDLDYVLGANSSISLYMFHGGTNFGFSNGAIWKNFTASFTTSYDYGSPLDESGRTNDLYFTLRDTILKYVPHGTVPEPPENLPRLEIPEFELTPLVGLFDTLTNATLSETPLTMEQLGQAYGLILYEHTANATLSGTLQPGDRARDRVIVYVNGVKKGVIDSTYSQPAQVSVSLQPGDKLQLLIENLGRVDYWSRESGTFVALEDPYKGINGDVTIGSDVLLGWNIHSIPLETPPAPHSTRQAQDLNMTAARSPPVFYRAIFSVDGDDSTDPALLDTFLAVPGGVKGNVWVNGFNIGRYWIIGPQQSLYLPGTVLKPGVKNEVVILELEPSAETLTVFGAAEREWGNYPDPDYP
ncbi:glycoside hydrolase family 35 protein [Xylariaceae sp. AK1471]|nr:glycoside hydrolase family 35 protein [Xylariaceae sp. AK1471]